MQKIYGAIERQDGLFKIGRNKWELIYGFGKDEEDAEFGYNYRQRFTHSPSLKKIKQTILEQINANVDEEILNGFVWGGIKVYLSEENQHNYKAAYDIAFQTSGATLPVKFKLGENEDEEAIYYTFADMETFSDFISSAFGYINKCLQKGWAEKDSVDWSKFVSNE